MSISLLKQIEIRQECINNACNIQNIKSAEVLPMAKKFEEWILIDGWDKNEL